MRSYAPALPKAEPPATIVRDSTSTRTTRASALRATTHVATNARRTIRRMTLIRQNLPSVCAHRYHGVYRRRATRGYRAGERGDREQHDAARPIRAGNVPPHAA